MILVIGKHYRYQNLKVQLIYSYKGSYQGDRVLVATPGNNFYSCMAGDLSEWSTPPKFPDEKKKILAYWNPENGRVKYFYEGKATELGAHWKREPRLDRT